jgi:hypothetical protein
MNVLKPALLPASSFLEAATGVNSLGHNLDAAIHRLAAPLTPIHEY